MIDKIYILHYSKLYDRKKNIIKQFEKYNIKNYQFIEDYDREKLSKDFIDRYCVGNNFSGIAGKCNAISQFELYKNIIKNNYKLCLILEDDAILCNDFNNKLNEYISKIPNDFEIGFLVDGCNLHVKNIKDNIIWYPSLYSRTCCAYLITKQACEKITKTILPFKQNIDLTLNEEIFKHNLKNYWCEPTIVSEGSKDGNYNTSV
jgi:GR25 family glycosyltransferase involved in LPS biosynthesis